jgi:hypothetical protein
MASPYKTRSTSTTTTAAAAAASSITVISQTGSTLPKNVSTEHRHFCIVLTNNPRMIQSSTRMLQNVTLTASTVSIFYI